MYPTGTLELVSYSGSCAGRVRDLCSVSYAMLQSTIHQRRANDASGFVMGANSAYGCETLSQQN